MSIHFVTSYALGRKHRLFSILPQLIDNGLKTVQFSWQEKTDKELFKCAELVRELTFKAGVKMIVNNRLDVALAVDADGLHIGKTDVPYNYARKLLPTKIIGVTVYDINDVNQYDSNVDYLGYGPIFKTRTHTSVQEPVGLNNLNKLKSMTNIPVVAIGGITEQNAHSVYNAGANNIAVVGAIYDTDDLKRTLINFASSA